MYRLNRRHICVELDVHVDGGRAKLCEEYAELMAELRRGMDVHVDGGRAELSSRRER